MVELRGAKAPAEVLFFAMTLLFCVGISNVAIYMTTRNVGIHSKRTAVAPSNHPSHTTQVEIYIDRVTQHEVGVVTIGGTGVSGRDRGIRFEGSDAGDTKRDASQKDGYEATPRSSLECSYPDVRSPTSAVSRPLSVPTLSVNLIGSIYQTQFMSTSPKSPNSAQYALTSPARTHSHSHLGSAVVDRIGTLQGEQSAFDGSFTVREQTVARNQSPISPFSQFEPGTFPPGVDPSARGALYTWK
jgi:hypothetical protein